MAGLFIIVHLAGLLPLLYAEGLEATDTPHIASIVNDSQETDAQHHHPGDRTDSCCVWQHHLAGVLPAVAEGGPSAPESSPMAGVNASAFIGSRPIRLERPPKSLLSI